MIKKVIGWGLVAAVAVLAFVIIATIDSCNRHADTRPCFGSSGK